MDHDSTILTDGLSQMSDTVKSLASRWVLHRTRAGLIKPHTGRSQRGNLDRFIEAHGANLTMRADRRVFERWLESIGHLSVNTRRVHTNTVRSFVVWAVANGHINQRALTLIPHVRAARAVPRAINKDQVVCLLRSLNTPKKRVVIGLMLWMGLRCAEVASIRVEDIDEREAIAHVKGKGDNERIVPVPPEFMLVLGQWLDLRRRVPGPLIPAPSGGQYLPSTISTLVSRWMHAAGIKVAARDGRSAHALRHTAASDVLDGGANITTVQALLGHADISTTAIYLRRAKLEDLRKAIGGRDYAA